MMNMWEKINQIDQHSRKKRFWLCMISFLITFVCMYIIYAVMHVVPFGERTLAWEDADIQYMDFFSYFRDVLLGRNSLKYSMSNTLGNTSIGIYSYYLASPLSVLVVFFKQSQFQYFFSLLLAIKLSLASTTACYYLLVRFKDGIRPVMTCLLACSYGMMQYTLAQGANIMWMDGVYLLPLILLGVYRLVEEKKTAPLAIPVALSILFNWYTGGINCLWSAFFFLGEYLIHMCHEKVTWKETILAVVRYGVAMVIGVCISAVLFLPSIFDLRNGRGSAFDWGMLSDTFNAQLFSPIRNYTVGGTSAPSQVSLFAGSLVLVGVLSFFFNRNYKCREKCIVGIGLVFAVFMYFYSPTHFLFSLLKTAESYWYRYSYVSIMYLIFVAGLSFSKADTKLRYFLVAIGYVIIYGLSLAFRQEYSPLQRIFTVTFILVTGVAVYLYFRAEGKWKKLLAVVMMVSVLSELGINGIYLARIYSLDEGIHYRTYVEALDEQLADLRKLDDGTYRISQTSERRNNAHLDESFGYNYWSNTGYTSCPDNRQLELLDHLGYPSHGARLNALAGSILPSDSFLGVKYVIAERQYPGLERNDTIAEANGKSVYENPYYLPMAFTYTDGGELGFTNVFEYQNAIYSALTGETEMLYTRLTPVVETVENVRTYHLTVPEGNYALYGNICTYGYTDATVGKTGTNGFHYSAWLTRGAFDIEVDPGETEVAVFYKDNQGLVNIADEQFYALNLDALAAASAKIRANEVQAVTIENGHVTCTVNAKTGENLFLSVPVSDGWTIKRNGEEISLVQPFATAMTSIPLVEGENVIEMTYHIPALTMGVLVTIFGIAMLMFITWMERKKNKKKSV